MANGGLIGGMLKMFQIVFGAVLVAVVAGWANSPSAPVLSHDNGDQAMQAYARIRPGMPLSQIGALGFDIAAAERLPKSVLMARYMPTDAARFDALDPAVKTCYRGSGDCTAYLFNASAGPVLVLVQNGRVTWKTMYNSVIV